MHFRLSLLVLLKEERQFQIEHFTFLHLRDARRAFRDQNLALTRKRDILAWRMCLNHTQHEKWEHPIFFDEENEKLLPKF